MEKILLSEIADCLGTDCPKECEITEISTDTRNLPVGCLFIAIKGEKFDAHDFVEKAVESGAAAVVSEKQVGDCPCLVVDSTRRALLKIARLYREKFSPILVGVTGSVGKTTTKEMIALVLSEKYNTLKTSGNLNNEIGLPKTLFGLAREHSCAVIEMGMSHFGEIDRLTNTACPTCAVITNIGFSHIENLGSREGILKAKLEILNGMSKDAPLFTNGDDKYLAPLKNTLDRPVYLYGIENENCDFRGTDIEEKDGNTTFSVKWENGTARVELPTVGVHNVMNALCAFAVGIKNGLSESSIVTALKKYRPEGMRQRIEKRGDMTLIIDCYNASPDSMRASLNVLSDMKCDGRKIAVLGDMLELGESSRKLHTLVGEYVRSCRPDMLFCYGTQSGYIAEEAKDAVPFVFHSDDKESIISRLQESVRPGDTVLFKGSRGMKLEEIIEKLN